LSVSRRNWPLRLHSPRASNRLRRSDLSRT
jgi:hypothetical protein